MTAREKFSLGQRVIQSREWTDRPGNKKPAREGTVFGFGFPSQNPRCVRVLIDGRKVATSWSMDFWEAK